MPAVRRLVLLAACSTILADARAGDESATRPRILAAPTRETLVPGARCVIEMRTKVDGTRMIYEGVLTRVDDEGMGGLGLAVERRDRKVVNRRPLMRKTPWLDRWLGRNVGVGYSTPDAEVGEEAFLPPVEIHSLKIVVEQQPGPRTGQAPADAVVRAARGPD